MSALIGGSAIRRFSLLIVLLLFCFAGCLEGIKGEKIFYGEDEEQYVVVYFANSTKTAVYVHGGAFITGSAKSWKSRRMAKRLVEEGWNVVSVNYRLCNKVPLKEILEDIKKGTEAGLREIGRKVKQERVVYIGNSAGATAGAFLFYDERMPTLDGIELFVSLAGVFGKEGKTVRGKCVVKKLEVSNKTLTPAIIVEGDEDVFDDVPYGNAEFLEGALMEKGVNATVVKIRGGHSAPYEWFLEEGVKEIG